MSKLFAVFLITIICSSCGRESHKKTSLSSLPERLSKASAGDTLLIEAGTYTNIELNLEGRGKKGAPIVIKAEKPGSVCIEGISNLRLCGEYIEVSGLYFRNGYSPQGSVIELRKGDKVANNCRITNCVIYYFNPPSRSSSGNWILMYGKNNRFDHNSMIGKLNAGVTLAVVLDEERNRNNKHHIDHNYFGVRPILGSNGGETIRVGSSHHALSSSNTTIEENMFDRCDGEVEIVSIKSGDNIVRHNIFLESAGVLALRHGNRNLVEGNAFIGNDKPHTGGVRIVNEGHIIKDNLFYRLQGDRFFAALGLMNAVPNSLPNRYHHVKDILIDNNRFINCDNILFCVGRDNERTLPPSNILLKDNQFIHREAKEVYHSFDDISSFRFENNKINYPSAVNLKGFINDRSLTGRINITPYTDRGIYGATWFTPEKEKPLTLSGHTISVKAGDNSLGEALKRAVEGDIIQLEEDGEYRIEKTIPVDKYLRIQKAQGLNKRPVIRFNGIQKDAFVTIMNGGKLEIQGIAFDGEGVTGKALANGGITALSETITPYLLTVDNCEFYNFNESNIAAISGQKSTFSPEIIIRNSYFHDMSGEGIQYADEKDDRGKYSVEKLIIENCTFHRLLGSAVNVYRGGNDESTSGPCLIVKDCRFENVDNKEQGSAMRLIGVQQAEIEHCIFVDSGKGGASIRFNEMSWDKIAVSNIILKNSGRISSFWGKVEKGNIQTIR